ncbi:MAG: MFS transporter [Acidimicrobiia bacterium]
MANPTPPGPRDPRFAGATPFSRLAVTHAFSVSGDVFFFLALSGSLFFTVSADAARPRVILALLFTMAPFAVVAPLMGPALDRIRGARSLMITVVGITQFVLCLVTANHLNDLALYPLAFSLLVLGKTYSISKSSLVPGLVRNHEELVTANARLSMIGVIAGAVAGVVAATILGVLDSDWVLRVGAFLYLAGGITALRIPRGSTRRQPVTTDQEAELEREELHLPSVVLAGTAMAVMRMAVGFLVLLLAFTFKRDAEPFWVFGAALAASSIGTFLGAIVAPRLREHVREEYILVASLLIPAVTTLIVARAYTTATALIASVVVGMGASAGKLAFDSVLQRDAPDAVRGRTFARMETRFQIVWVIGSLLAVVFVPGPQLGMLLLALTLGFAGLSYLGGLRHGRDRPGTPPRPTFADRIRAWRQSRSAGDLPDA